MFCKYCGTKLDDVQKFCGVCGRAVDRNIKFADPAAKLLDDAEKNEPVAVEVAAEETVQPVEECAEVAEAAEQLEATEVTDDALEEETVPVVLEETISETEPEPVAPTGLRIGLLVWSIINMAFGMYPFGIPALIMNIRSAKKPLDKTKKNISYIKILNFTGSLALALVVFYGLYMSLMHSFN